jgi:hypothetical protein
MQNLSDEDIDKLFKQAADQQLPKFDPADWADMTSRLDAVAKRPWSNYYTWTGGLVILIVVIWIGWTISMPKTMSNTQTAHATLQTEVIPKAKKLSHAFQAGSSVEHAVNSSTLNGKDKVETQSTSNEKKVSLSSTNSTRSVSEKAEHVADVPLTSLMKKPGSSGNAITAQPSVSTMLSFSEVKDVNTILESQKNANVTDGDIWNDADQKNNVTHTLGALNNGSVTPIQNEEAILSTSQINQEAEITNAANIPENRNLGIDNFKKIIDSVNSVAVQQEKVSMEAVKTNRQDSVMKKSILSRFAIKATVAPDFSSDRFKTFDKMGWNYGLIVEYFFIEKLSLSAGVLWSRKFYSARDVAYSGYRADRASGDCRMWDIPLNVKYYFMPSKKYSFFASAGVSSYLMKEENYVFEVDTNQGTNTYSKQIVNENKEWFKTLNVSFGMQKKINTRIAIQVEPFMKVPLAGVGEGNISLASFGSFFSVRYRFLSNLN